MGSGEQNLPGNERMQLLTVDEAAQALRLHPSSLRRIIRRGKLPLIRIGRAQRVDPEDLRRFIDARRFRRVISAMRGSSGAKVESAWEEYQREGEDTA